MASLQPRSSITSSEIELYASTRALNPARGIPSLKDPTEAIKRSSVLFCTNNDVMKDIPFIRFYQTSVFESLMLFFCYSIHNPPIRLKITRA